MQLNTEQLSQHLIQTLAPLYIVISDEMLLAQEATDKIRAAARAQSFSERTVLTLARGFDWQQLSLAQQERSLFGDKRLIELRLPTGKPGKDGSAALQHHVKHLHDEALTLITLPKLDRTTRDSTWCRALAQHGVVIEIASIERAQLPTWIAQRLQQQQQHTHSDALEFMANRVEGNLLAAHQEIQKLALLYPSGDLSTEQIHDAVLNVARYDVFKLNEAMLAGDAPRLLRMLEGLQGEGEAPVLVLWALTEEIRTLAKIQQGQQSGRPVAQLLRDNRVWGMRERLIPSALQRVSPAKVRTALRHAALLDRASKGIKVPMLHPDIWLELRQLALRIAGATR